MRHREAGGSQNSPIYQNHPPIQGTGCRWLDFPTLFLKPLALEIAQRDSLVTQEWVDSICMHRPGRDGDNYGTTRGFQEHLHTGAWDGRRQCPTFLLKWIRNSPAWVKQRLTWVRSATALLPTSAWHSGARRNGSIPGNTGQPASSCRADALAAQPPPTRKRPCYTQRPPMGSPHLFFFLIEYNTGECRCMCYWKEPNPPASSSWRKVPDFLSKPSKEDWKPLRAWSKLLPASGREGCPG